MAKGLCSKVKKVCGKLYRAFKSLTGLIIILILYNIIGAVIFVHLEARHEKSVVVGPKTDHKNILQVLYNVSSVLDSDQYDMLKNETIALIERFEAESLSDEHHERTWDFWKAMFFCGTIYTTIGYGNIYPKTDAGKVVAIFYAAFGIPLAMKVLALIGKKLSLVLKFVYFRMKNCFCRDTNENSRYTVQDTQNDHVVSVQLTDKREDNVEIQTERKEEQIKKEMNNNLPIVVPIFILIVYILLGGLMYTLWEDWGYLDAFYFVFISVSTIGFGDITPAHTKYFIVTSIYVFVGLALVSMCINVLIDFYILSLKVAWSQVDKVTTKVRKGCGCGGRRQSI